MAGKSSTVKGIRRYMKSLRLSYKAIKCGLWETSDNEWKYVKELLGTIERWGQSNEPYYSYISGKKPFWWLASKRTSDPSGYVREQNKRFIEIVSGLEEIYSKRYDYHYGVKEGGQ